MSIITLKNLAEDLAELLTVENFRIVDSRMRSYGSKEARYVAATVISRFIGALVFRTLSETQSLNRTQKQHEEFILKNMAELKTQIQNAVANGFQNAMSAFNEQPIEYYCTIKPVPDPKSNVVN